MSIVIKPTDEKSNFRSLAGADYKWMVVASIDYKFTAFEDNTRLFVNGSLNTTLSKQTITSISLTAGDIVRSDKSFSFVSTAGGKTGICYGWEGTIFGHRVDRYSPTFYITATRRDATVTITRQTSGTVVVNNASVAKDSLYSYTASDTDDQYIITSNYPIACYVDDQEASGGSADSLPLFPPSTDLFGTFSGGGHIIASQASTSYNGYGTGGTTISGTLSSIGSSTESVIGAGSQFAGESTRVIADKPIFAESQADADGGEMTPFVSKEAFGTQFVIPNIENEFVKLVSDVPANYEVFNTSGTSVGTGTLTGVDISGVEGGIYNAYLGSGTAGDTLTTQGNLIVTDQPVCAVFESEGDDETILFAKAAVNNTSTNVNPKIVTDGLLMVLDAGNTKSYSGSGSDWLDLSGNNFHMSLKNSPTFTNSGGIKYFSLDGTNDHGICDGTVSGSTSATVANLGLGGSQSRTVVCIANMKNSVGSTNGGLFDLGDTGVAGQHFSLRRNGYASWRAQFWSTPDYDFNYDGNGIWTMYSQVYGSDLIGKTFGNNGVLLGQDASSFTLVTAGSRPFEMGRYSSSAYVGADIAYYLVYNKALTVPEIKQNYQALRSRFGI